MGLLSYGQATWLIREASDYLWKTLIMVFDRG